MSINDYSLQLRQLTYSCNLYSSLPRRGGENKAKVKHRKTSVYSALRWTGRGCSFVTSTPVHRAGGVLSFYPQWSPSGGFARQLQSACQLVIALSRARRLWSCSLLWVKKKILVCMYIFYDCYFFITVPLRVLQCFWICDRASDDMFSIAFFAIFMLRVRWVKKVTDVFINKISENQIFFFPVSRYSFVGLHLGRGGEKTTVTHKKMLISR